MRLLRLLVGLALVASAAAAAATQPRDAVSLLLADFAGTV